MDVMTVIALIDDACVLVRIHRDVVRILDKVEG